MHFFISFTIHPFSRYKIPRKQPGFVHSWGYRMDGFIVICVSCQWYQVSWGSQRAQKLPRIHLPNTYNFLSLRAESGKGPPPFWSTKLAWWPTSETNEHRVWTKKIEGDRDRRQKTQLNTSWNWQVRTVRTRWQDWLKGCAIDVLYLKCLVSYILIHRTVIELWTNIMYYIKIC